MSDPLVTGLLTKNLFHILVCLLLILLVGGAAALPAEAARRRSSPLTGELEWRFADYSSDRPGEDFEGSHFAQKYSLMYSLAGNVYNSRGGIYDVGIGFEWWDVDGKYGDEDISLSSSKLLYNGEILLAPAGLPFRLHLYAFDRDSASFSEESDPGSVLNAGIITDVNNGTNQVIGGTLVAGIRNGSYLGEYRDVLARFPKVYVDFRQSDVRDLEGETPEHYRDRNLAFVSLNKKDNWFHYRYRSHEDFIDKINNYTEKIIQIGTIDHLLYRQWIWLTNWVRLSTDASWTTTDYYATLDSEPEEIFDYNLFLVGRTGRLTFSSMNSFSRGTVGQELHKTLEVPFYFSYDINADRRFRGELSLEREDHSWADSLSPKGSFDNIYAYGKLETGLISPLRFDYTLELESLEGDGYYGRGQNGRGSVEAYNNPAYRTDRSWLVSYSLGNFRGTNIADQDVNFVENEAVLSASHQFTPKLRVGATQTLVYGSGELDTSISRKITPASDSGLFGTLDNLDHADGEVLHATTEFYLDYNSGRLANRFAAVYDYLKASDADSTASLELQHRLRYQRPTFHVRMLNKLRTGDAAGETIGFVSNQFGEGTVVSDADFFFESHLQVHYSPDRAWKMSGNLDYQWSHGAYDSSLLLLRERASYTFYHSNGILRRWLELNQEVNLEQGWEDIGEDRVYGDFTLGCTWYPTYNTYLRGNLGLEYYDPGQNIMTYGLDVGVDFPLFKVEASYEYGFSETEDGGKIKDHRWELVVKKLI